MRILHDNVVPRARLLLMIALTTTLGPFVCHQVSALQLNVCLTPSLYSETDTPGLLGVQLRPMVALETAAAIRAIHDINTRNCTMVPNCSSMLELPGGGHITVNPLLIDMLSFQATAAPRAVLACESLGAHVLVGMVTSSQCQAAALTASTYGLPIISHAAKSPSLYNREQYWNYASSTWSSSAKAIGMVELFAHFGWTKVTLLYENDYRGVGYQKVFNKHALLKGITVDNLLISDTANDGLEQSLSSRMHAFEVLNTSPNTAVVIAMQSAEFLQFAYMAQEHGVDFHSKSWFLGDQSAQSLATAREQSPSSIPDAGFLHGFVGVKHAWPTDAQRAAMEEYLRDIEWDPEVTSIYRGPDGSPDGRTDSEAIANALELGVTDEVLYIYDAIWAVAAAASRAAEESTLEIRSRGSDDGSAGQELMVNSTKIIPEMFSGPAFHGASGKVAFDSQTGYRRGLDLPLSLDNMVFDGETYEIMNVGTVSVTSENDTRTTIIELGTGSPLEWPDGSTYPQIPSDGSREKFQNELLQWGIAVVGCAFGIVAFVAVTMCCKTRTLHHRIQAIEKIEIDMESPLAKMIAFLKKYRQSGIPIGPYVLNRSSIRAEATALLNLIISQSGNLAAPDLSNQFAEAPELATDIARFLASNFVRQPSVRNLRNKTKPSMESCHWDEFDVISSSPSISEPSNSLGVDATMGAQYGLVNTRISNSFWADDTPMSNKKPQKLVVPERVRQLLGVDYFTDFITTRSPLNGITSPLAAVAQQGIGMLNLDLVLKGSNTADRLVRFAKRVEAGYPSNFYHSKNHVADVSNRMISLLTKCGIGNVISADSQVLMMSAMVAAFLHDFEHPQVTNHFLVDQGMPLALDFNDQSVSENAALRRGLALLEDPQLNFLSRWKKPEKKQLRECVIQIILATDMVRHFDLVTQFEAQVASNPQLEKLKTSREKWESMTHAQRVLTLQMAMKVSDLGHCALPMDQHQEWVRRLEEEMFLQGDREKENKSDAISFLMDRNKPGVNCGKNQVGFSKMIVIPLFKTWCNVFPECTSLLSQANANLAAWERLAATEDNA